MDGSDDLKDLTNGIRHPLGYTSSFGLGAQTRFSNGVYDRWFNGLVAEVVLISTTVNTATRQRIEGYLAHKWGLTSKLPVAHPYKYLKPLRNTLPAYSDYTENLVSHVTFNESLNGDYEEYVNGDPIYLVGTLPTRVSAPSGHAAQFDGSTTLVMDYTIPLTNVSFAFKFRTTASGTMCLISTGAGQIMAGSDRYVELVSGEIQAVLNGETIISSGLSLNDGQWHDVVYVYGTNIGGQTLIVDGVIVASGTEDTSTGVDHDFVGIGGRDTGTNEYTGDIDDIRIYSETLGVHEANVIRDAYGDYAIDERGRRATIKEDSHVVVTLDTVVSVNDDTVIEFDFESTEEAEWHGISLTNDPGKSDFADVFKFFGTVDADGDIVDYEDYQLVDGVKHYKIPIGKYIPADDYGYIVIVTSNVASPNVGDTAVSNVQIYDDKTNYEVVEALSKGVVLNGTEILELENHPAMLNVNHGFAFAFKTAYRNATIVQHGDMATNGYRFFIGNDGWLDFQYVTNGTVRSQIYPLSVDDDIMHHLFIHYEHSTKEVRYGIDGFLGSVTWPGTFNSELTGPLWIGGYDGSYDVGTPQYLIPDMFEGTIDYIKLASGDVSFEQTVAMTQRVKVLSGAGSIEFPTGYCGALFDRDSIPLESYGTIILAVKMPSILSRSITAISGSDSSSLNALQLTSDPTNVLSFVREGDAEYLSTHTVTADEVLVVALTSVSGENQVYISKNLSGRETLATSGDFKLPTEVLGEKGPFELIRLVGYSTPLNETEERYLIRQIMKHPSVGLL